VQTNVAPETVAFMNWLKPALDHLSSRPFRNYRLTNNDGTSTSSSWASAQSNVDAWVGAISSATATCSRSRSSHGVTPPSHDREAMAEFEMP
jgi:hypothetical protein